MLRLTIHLWMKISAEIQCNAQNTMQISPKIRYKFIILIRNNRLGTLHSLHGNHIGNHCESINYNSIASSPLGEWGEPTTKSIVLFSHFLIGISNGFKNPAGLWWLAFTFWQIPHKATYFAIINHYPLPPEDLLQIQIHLVSPRCTIYGMRWVSLKITIFTSAFCGTHRWRPK